MSNILVIVEGEVTEPKYFKQFQEFHKELFLKKEINLHLLSYNLMGILFIIFIVN